MTPPQSSEEGTERVTLIAKCPEHGLHGQRASCFECGGPVEQVPMVPAPTPDQLTVRLRRVAEELDARADGHAVKDVEVSEQLGGDRHVATAHFAASEVLREAAQLVRDAALEGSSEEPRCSCEPLPDFDELQAGKRWEASPDCPIHGATSKEGTDCGEGS